MKVLFLGEITAKAGLDAVRDGLRPYVKEQGVDLVIANGEGVTSGFGIGTQHAMTLFKYGIDIITGGEKIFFKLDMQEFITRKDRILRPANYPGDVPGRGCRFYNVGSQKVSVINLLGMTDFNCHLDNPFPQAEFLVSKALEQTPFVFLVFHAGTTAEKASMGYLLDGKASAVIGTHTKVMTADARLLPRGTAYISDNGRCGSFMSVGGFAPENEIQKFTTGLYRRSMECFDDVRLQGALVEVGPDGRAVSISAVNLPVGKKEQS